MRLNKEEAKILSDLYKHIDALYSITDRVSYHQWVSKPLRDVKERLTLMGPTFEKFMEKFNNAS